MDLIMPKKGDTFQTYSENLMIQFIQSYLNNEGSQLATAKKYELISIGFGAEILKYRRLFRLKLNKALYQTKA
ncbi:hypothetical protein MRBL20_004837 [Peribacillus frigoritolerans]